MVPFVDVFVEMPGASVKEVEERVSIPHGEEAAGDPGGRVRLLDQPARGQRWRSCASTSGEDEERSMVKLHDKLCANFDLIPPGASQPLDQAPLDRRRADPGPDALERARGSVHAAPDRRRSSTTRSRPSPTCRRPAHRRAAPPAPRDARPRPPGRLRRDTGRGAGGARRGQPRAAGGALRARQPGVPGGRGSLPGGPGRARAGRGRRHRAVGPVHLRDVASIDDGPEEPREYVLMAGGARAPGAAPAPGAARTRRSRCRWPSARAPTPS